MWDVKEVIEDIELIDEKVLSELCGM